MKLKLDLHDIYNRSTDIDRALRDIMDEAVRIKAKAIEIIPGKGSGALKKHVLRWLDQKDIKALYHRVEKDSDNFGRIFVHFWGVGVVGGFTMKNMVTPLRRQNRAPIRCGPGSRAGGSRPRA